MITRILLSFVPSQIIFFMAVSKLNYKYYVSVDIYFNMLSENHNFMGLLLFLDIFSCAMAC